MTGSSVSLQAADGDDLDRVVSLLAAADLPHWDVREKPDCFYLARANRRVVGAGGLETCGSSGLLRSVVVAEGARGRGFGRAVVDALESRARSQGVSSLFLLTEGTEGFFRRCGYESVDRECAPAGVRATTQFAELCPATATCMRTRLAGAPGDGGRA